MASTDIIIVSYKDEEPLKKCIASIKEHCIDYNIIIEDNNVNNRGFSVAVNDGIKKGTAPTIWLVNSDCIILEGAQQGLIDMFSYGEQVGIVGSMQRDFQDTDIIRHGGTTVAFPSGVHSGGRISMGHCRIPTKQKWVNFASAGLKRTMIEKIGFLNSDMFLLYSDSDYCYYARSMGYEVWYTPHSQVLHRLNASKTITEWHQKDMLTFMKKWNIEQLPDGNFKYGELFAKLDRFP